MAAVTTLTLLTGFVVSARSPASAQKGFAMAKLFWRGLTALIATLLSTAVWAADTAEILLKLDRQMAADAIAKGAVAAFEPRLAVNILMMAQGPIDPTTGKASVMAGFKQIVSKGVTLTWTPEAAVILGDGQSGYTTGRWLTVSPPKLPAIKDPKSKTPVAKPRERKKYGHYARLWTKQADGSWKIALDMMYRGRKPGSKVDDHDTR